MLDNVRTEVLVNECYVLLYRYYLVHFDSWMQQYHYVKYHLGF